MDDEKKVASFIQRGLEGSATRWTGPRWTRRAPAWLRLESYDAIILDIQLPGMVARRCSASLRGRGITTPVLMLTVRDSVDDKVTAL